MLRASASSIKFTSVYKTEAPYEDKPFSYFLEIDGVNILLDCGWDEKFTPSYLEDLLPFVEQADLVLISSSEFVACGALPFVVEHLKPGAFVTAANSTAKVGIHSCLHTFLYQYPNTASFRLGDRVFELNVDKIYSAFRSTKEPFGGRITKSKNKVDVQCIMVFGGRLFGGYNWTINCQIDSLFYCPDFSFRPSRLLKTMQFPNAASVLFINSAPLHVTPAPTTAPKVYEETMQELMKSFLQSLRNGGDVLIPVNVAGRGLEVLEIIARLFKEGGGERYKIVLASLQSQEIIDKVTTMTEVLADSVVVSNEPMFSKVVTCKSVEEVKAIHGPKVCIADGETLEYGIAAELAELFMEDDRNYILFTSKPKDNTNAKKIMQSAEGEDIMFNYTKRMKLSKEELEEYYIRLEREIELERQKLEETGAFGMRDDIEVDASDEDENEEPFDAKTGSKNTPSKGAAASAPLQKPVGLYFPDYVKFQPKQGFNFPVLENNNTLHDTKKDDSLAYGLPISEEEKRLLKQKAPSQAIQDNLKNLNLINDAQQEANLPSKIVSVSKQLTRHLHCRMIDLSGLPDVKAERTLLKTKLFFSRKVVAIRGSPDDFRNLSNFCRSEKVMKCGGDSVFLPQPKIALELATQLFSYNVNLDAQLLAAVDKNQSRVRERNTDDMWEIGWVDGLLKDDEHEKPLPIDSRVSKKFAGENEVASAIMHLSALKDDEVQKCAEVKAKNNLNKGSFFFGDAELNHLRDSSRKETFLNCEMHRKAPLLIYEDGVCVHKSLSQKGTLVTVSSVVTPNMFTVRKSLYNQFSQII